MAGEPSWKVIGDADIVVDGKFVEPGATFEAPAEVVEQVLVRGLVEPAGEPAKSEPAKGKRS